MKNSKAEHEINALFSLLENWGALSGLTKGEREYIKSGLANIATAAVSDMFSMMTDAKNDFSKTMREAAKQ